MNRIGTMSIGITAPIIKAGDDLKQIVFDSVTNTFNENNMKIENNDIICVTESILAISQNNFATVDDIAESIKKSIGENKTICIYKPILSRNRFSMILKGISKVTKKIIIQLDTPFDEVGNSLSSFIAENDPIGNCLYTEEDFNRIHEYNNVPKTHIFTGINYIEYYKSICECECEIVICKNIEPMVEEYYSKCDGIIDCRNHSDGDGLYDIVMLYDDVIPDDWYVMSLSDILNESNNNTGYNEEFGVKGSNLSSENSIKLFPINSKNFAFGLQAKFKDELNVNVEVAVYGDGCFKDPIGGIWEFADPVVCPGYTDRLIGTPNELKLKYLNTNKNLSENEIKEVIKNKSNSLVGNMESQGTTPRRYTDLIGSLADLTSGSGDKGTPIVVIKNYFKNYSE